jgi:hypothetical protein
MDTMTKVTLTICGGMLALIVVMIGILGTAQGCATGETQQLITYQNSQNGEWVTEPVYGECK